MLFEEYLSDVVKYLELPAETTDDLHWLIEWGTFILEGLETGLTALSSPSSSRETSETICTLERHISFFSNYFPLGSIDSTVEYNLANYQRHYGKYNQRSFVEGFENISALLSSYLRSESLQGIRIARNMFDDDGHVFRPTALPFVVEDLSLKRLQALAELKQLNLLVRFKEVIDFKVKSAMIQPSSLKALTKKMFDLDLSELRSSLLWHVLGLLINLRESLKRKYFPGMFYETSDLLYIEQLLLTKLIIVNNKWEGVILEGKHRHPYRNAILALAEVLLNKKYLKVKLSFGKKLTLKEVVLAFCTHFGIQMSERASTDKAENHELILKHFDNLIPERK